MNNKLSRIILFTIITSMLVLVSGLSATALDFTAFDQHSGKDFFTIKDESGKVIAELASLVSVGDYLITEDDSGYRITVVDKFNATAKFEGKVDLRQPGWVMVKDAQTSSSTDSIRVQAEGEQGRAGQRRVGLYFTHSEESYVPNSGTAQEDRGDIYQVGESLAKALEKNGVNAEVADAIHSPRDANSYNRSRGTAVKLLKNQPALLIDVHRDGIPDPNYYRKKVKGQPIVQTRLVVGKQNANRSVNFDFAKRIKAKANEMYPGLVKEIFWASGNYNQDLAPRAILIEFGTHTNDLNKAKVAATMMGDVLAAIVGPGAAPEGEKRDQPRARGVGLGEPGDQTGGWSTILWILGITAVIFIGYALLNSKGIGGIKYMLSKFGSKEMSGFFGRVKDKPKKEIKIPPDEKNNDQE